MRAYSTNKTSVNLSHAWFPGDLEGDGDGIMANERCSRGSLSRHSAGQPIDADDIGKSEIYNSHTLGELPRLSSASSLAMSDSFGTFDAMTGAFLYIIRNARLDSVGQSQSCVVSKLLRILILETDRLSEASLMRDEFSVSRDAGVLAAIRVRVDIIGHARNNM